MAGTVSAAVSAPRRPLARRLAGVLGPDWAAAWFFYAPTFILLFVLIAWPFAQGLYIGFTRTLGTSLVLGEFIGFDNYWQLFDDSAYLFSLRLTVVFTALTEIFKPTLGIIAALLIHNLRRYRALISALILLPWIVPGIVQALIWRAMFNPIHGALNYVLEVTRVSGPLPWLGDPTVALWCIVLVNVWAGIPFFTITNLAGLKSIDPDLYSAAAVDGANAWQRFRYVTLPGLQYTLTVSILLSTIFTMNSFGTIYLLTSGGPLNATQVLGILTYERGFNARDFGSGVAIALSILPFIGLIIWVLASYMTAGTRAQAAGDGDALPVRVFRPIVWPFRMLFVLLFDAIELVGMVFGRLARALRGGQEQTLAGARTGRRVLTGFSLFVLAMLLTFELFPFFFAFVTAFKTHDQILSMTSPLWPTTWSFAQFDKLFTEEPDFFVWYRNTVFVALAATLIGVIAAASGAYALVRLRWRGSSTFSTLMLVTYMMPSVVMLIPFYMIMNWLKMANSLWGLIIVYPSFTLPFCTWLLMGYYRTIPEELEDAARIDGANRLQVFVKLIIPLSKPALMATTLFGITAAWNEFFFAYILIRSQQFLTLPVGLYRMVFNDVFPIGMMMGAALMMAIPVLIIYGFAQKFMTEGLTLGSVKG